jgi:hypothetical protein
LRSARAGARRDIARRFPIGSTAHDGHRPLTTLQCCSQLPLLLDRRPACSANDHSHAPAHSRGDGNRNSFIAPPRAATALSRRGPRPAVTTATSQPITRGSQIPIAPARRTVLPLPARGFLLRGLSDACPRSAPQCQVMGRHLITLNEPRHSRVRPGRSGVGAELPIRLHAASGSSGPEADFSRSVASRRGAEAEDIGSRTASP